MNLKNEVKVSVSSVKAEFPQYSATQYNNRYIFIFSLILGLLCGCGPSSTDDFKQQGEAISRLITRDLKKVKSREELVKIVPLLKKRFSDLVDLMIEARKFQQKYPDALAAEELEPEMDDALLTELKRVYRLEGGREIIEDCQREALIRLDSFEHKRSRIRK